MVQFWCLIQFDVCEEIKLDSLRQIFGARTVEQPSFKHPAPGYVRYQRPPVLEAIDPLVLDSGERLHGQIKYYDYGVLSVVFELPFSGEWDTLVRLAGRWVWDVDFVRHASRIARQRLERAGARPGEALSGVAERGLFHFSRERVGGKSRRAAAVCHSHGAEIAQIVRGETAQLSEGERGEILQSRISYYPNDLAVIGWNAAFLYDTRPAPRPRFSCWNTPTRSSSNSAITMSYSPASWKAFTIRSKKAPGLGSLAPGACRHQVAYGPAGCHRTYRAC